MDNSIMTFIILAFWDLISRMKVFFIAKPFTIQYRLFTSQKNMPFENIVGKGENGRKCWLLAFSTFSHNIFYPSHKEFLFVITSILFSANALNLNQSKDFSFGKELTLHHTIPTFNSFKREGF